MRHSLLALLSAATLAATIPGSHAEDAGGYNIKLNRPRMAGEKTHEHFKIRTEKLQRMSSAGKVLKETKEEIKADLSGLSEIIEVSPRGKIQKFKFTVGKFSVQLNAYPVQESLKAGAIISGMLNEKGEPTFTCSDGELAPTALKILAGIFQLTPDRPNDTTDDLAFATNQPRAIGSEWDINKAEALKTMPPNMPFKLSENQISGRVKFPSAKQIAGKEHCLMQGEITVKPAEITGMPPNFKLASMTITAGVENVVPVDDKAVIPSGKSSFRSEISGHMDTPTGKMLLEIIERRDKEDETQRVE